MSLDILQKCYFAKTWFKTAALYFIPGINRISKASPGAGVWHGSLACLYLPSECLVWVLALLVLQLPAIYTLGGGRWWLTHLGPWHLRRRPRCRSGLLTLALPSHNHCGYLNSEPADGRTLYASAIQRKKKEKEGKKTLNFLWILRQIFKNLFHF